MTELRAFSFGGVPVYNPQSLSKAEAVAQFHVRQSTYLALLELLREERPSHVLLIGARGMGKTTLLQRVGYGVQDDPGLSARYVVLVFPEEQYNVNRLHHFLLNTIDALADALEREENWRLLARVEEFAERTAASTPEQIQDRVPQFLAEIRHQLKRNILLLVDNADRLFETIENAQQWRFRELLSTRSDLTFFGATTQASEGIYGPDRAFFEFFRIYQLTPLTLSEVKELLLRLSESVEEKQGEKGFAKQRVTEWLDADPGRLQTLVQLTGGNPRTTVLLFHLVLDGLAGGAREYLEQLLDQVTPGYKGRIDELPSQAQQVFDAVALRWNPATAIEVHGDTGLETSAVSTQLTRLVRQGILEKADPGESKKAMYQVAERFFNIWYLMRASRRVRAKLRWFVEFLRVFYDSSELDRIARARVDCHQGAWGGCQAEIETLFAYVLASGTPRAVFEDYLRQKCSDSDIREMRPHLELLVATNGAGAPTTSELDQVDVEAQIKRAIETEPNKADHWSSLGNLLAGQDRATEAEAAFRKALELDPNAFAVWARLAALLINRPERVEDAEIASRRATELAPDVAAYWGLLGASLILRPERAAEAEMASRAGISLDPTATLPRLILFAILATQPQRSAEAESVIRTAIEFDPMDASLWCALAGVLIGQKPDRAGEAEMAFRKATELDPTNATVWMNLGVFLSNEHGRAKDAEAAFRNAVQLAPSHSVYVRTLGVLLYCELGALREAVGYLRQAHELAPNDHVSTAMYEAGLQESGIEPSEPLVSSDIYDEPAFWGELLGLCANYAPFGKLLLGICDLVQRRGRPNRFAALFRAVSLAQLGDFPRASVALEDALSGDPIEQLSLGTSMLETFFTAAARNGHVQDCIRLIEKKGWEDAWRPIYEALQAIQAGSTAHLQKVAVEIRDPAQVILARIAPGLK